jgi:hypothetical protein
MSILNATASGLSITSDNTGLLYLQSSGANTFVINASGAFGLGNTPNYGTAGQALVSNGPSSPPTWGNGGMPVGKVISLSLFL